MKNFLLSISCFLLAFLVNAQNDVTTFLGIPVDGTKEEMIRKLKDKGFTPDDYDSDRLKGEFNGKEVYVSVVTNRDKVYRIVVSDKGRETAEDIKIRFNKLCSQFENNPKYLTFEDQKIPEDEKIWLNFRDKRYEAGFYQHQFSEEENSIIRDKVLNGLLTKYSAEEIQSPTEEIEAEIRNTTLKYLSESISKKTVWFMICKDELNGIPRREYYIMIFYDNGYNQANGEDL